MASPDERRAILKDQSSIYERDYLPSLKPFEGVGDVFRILTEQGATDCKRLSFKRCRTLLNADDFIAATACGDNAEHGKPDPRLVGMALRKLGIASPQAVMVGDTPYDAEAGLEAGTKVAGVLSEGFAEKVLRQTGCFAVALDLKALLPSLLFKESGPELCQSDWLRST